LSGVKGEERNNRLPLSKWFMLIPNIMQVMHRIQYQKFEV
jgi:hypothetical protein